jgi:sterol desaturase/sphingolipid hydroxylase (fatty acid hydroxylase superfamily)
MSANWLELGLGVGLLALILIELRDPQFRHGWRLDPGRTKRNLGFGLASLAVVVVLKWTNAAVQSLPIVRLLDWTDAGVLAPIACALVAEFAGWSLHYVKHRNGFLWKFHFQHHRDHQYNIWLTAHTHGLEVVVSGIILAVLLSLVGFSVITIEIYLVYYGFMKVLQHSAHDYSFGFLDRVLVTPGYHRLHHEVSSACNYGITLTVFDVIFRTARWPLPAPGPRDYGVSSDDALPFGFWEEMTFFLRRPRAAAKSRIEERNSAR